MADGDARKGSKPAVRPRTLAGSAAAATLELTLDDLLHQPLPEHLPAEMFTGPGLIALADLLPVMTAFIDRDLVYRFINKPLAEWLGRPRKATSSASTMPRGDRRGRLRERKPMIEAALDGRAPVLRRRVRPSRARGTRRGAEPTMCRGPTPRRRGRRASSCWSRTSPSRRVAERALKESEARFRRIANSAPAMMWVTRLDRVRDFVNDAYVEFVAGLAATDEAPDARLAQPRSIPTTSTGSSPRASPARRRGSRSRSRGATCAATANIAGCAACRSRASGRTGS